MGDVFKEQIVKRNPTGMDVIKRTGLILLVVIVFIACIGIPMLTPFTPIITLAVGFGAFFLNGYLKVEYEYIFTNGELDIDVIYNRSRRKRLFSTSVKSFEIMAHVDDMNHAGSFNRAHEIHDYSSGVKGPNTYAFLANYNNKQLKVIIEPNEKMMDAIKGSIPRSKLHLRV